MTIKLYHGSITDFVEIDVNKGKGYKDFGKGFYTTGNRGHAERLVKRNVRIELDRRRKLGKSVKDIKAYLYIYEINSDVYERYNTKHFTKADIEWVRFVLANRSSAKSVHDYDIVIGPTADDNTKITFSAFKSGVYGDINTPQAINRLIEFLKVDKLSRQIFFGNNNVVKELVLKEREIII